jgi:hypothetical protein
MIRTDLQHRSHPQHGQEKTAGRALAQRASVPSRVVPLKTLYLELSVRRDLFDDESFAVQAERHPEWYIG